MATTDLFSRGFGTAWGHTRSYANLLPPISVGNNGNRWEVAQIGRLEFVSAERICILKTANDRLWFTKESPGVFVPLTTIYGELRHDASAEEFTHTNSSGERRVYYDNSGSVPAALRGRLKRILDRFGNQATAQYDGNNRLATIEWDGDGQRETYLYTYHDAPHAGLLESVTHQVNGGSVRRVRYAYYTAADAFGNLSDLKHVATEEFNVIAQAWSTIDQYAYRYYKGTSSNLLRFVVEPESYDAMEASGIDPLTTADIAPYADFHFVYDAQSRVVSETLRGGEQTFTFAYLANNALPPLSDKNTWAVKTTETQPDGNEKRVYSNEAGSVVLNAFEDKSSGEIWYESFVRNDSGRVIQRATASAVSTVTEPATSTDTLTVNLRTSNGLIYVFDYWDSTDAAQGAAKNYPKSQGVKKGTSGTVDLVYQTKWNTHTVNGIDAHLVEEELEFPNPGSVVAEAFSTKTAYTYFTDANGDDTYQIKQKVTTLPVIPVNQNGDGLEHTITTVYDELGNRTWERDARGFITHWSWDEATGARKQMIRDVDTSLVAGAPAGWAAPTGGGLNLVTDYESDDQGRIVKELGPAHAVQLHESDTEPTVIRTVSFTVYRDDIRETWTAQGYATGNAPSYGYETVGPVSIERRDGNGNIVDTIMSRRECSCGPLKEKEAFPQHRWVRWTRTYFDQWGWKTEARAYFKIPNNGEGEEGDNYNATRFGYDEMGRQIKEVSPGGTVNRQVYDSRGLVIERWVGTNDNGATETDPSGGGATGNNMVLVLSQQFDNGNPGGNGNVTKETRPVDTVTADDRITWFNYDYRDRRLETITSDGTTFFITKTSYDNLDRLTESTNYHTDAVTDANRTALAKSYWDNQDRTYKSETYAVNVSTGVLGNALRSETWFDPSGNPIKQLGMGSEAFTKTVYDSLGRQTAIYSAYHPGTSSNDTVVTQSESTWDAAGNLILSTGFLRFHDSTGTGALNGPNDAQPKARRSYQANWPDGIGRVRVRADYGTNGGAALVRPGVAPERSDAILVTTTLFGPAGTAIGSIDPMGTESRWFNDNRGRQIRLIENFVDSSCAAVETTNQAPSTTNLKSDENRTSEYVYHADGGLKRLTLINDVTGDQVTRWIYGTTLDDSGLATSYLLRAKIYPESDDAAAPLGDGPDGIFERIEYAYNRQADLIQMTDPNGTVHDYDFDKLGRQTQDRVTTFASHIDDAVKRIANGYNLQGRLETVTSLDNATVGSGTVVNQVAFAYNGFGQMIEDSQSHSGAVDGSTPAVGYAYADGSSGNTARMTALTYPNGRIVNYGYGTTDGANDLLSRVETLKIQGESQDTCQYTYAGLDWFPKITYPEPAVELTYVKDAGQPVGDAGDDYIGFDRFGRTAEMNWRKTSDSSELDHIQYGYNRASNRTWRKNLVAAASGGGQDEAYRYDGLYQLSDFSRGNLNINHTLVGAIPENEEQFSYDPTGNWLGYVRKSDGAVDLDQTRVNNQDNQITQLDASSDGIAHDLAGNTTLMPPNASGDWSYSLTLTWDGWNRIVKVVDDTTEVAAYQYDGLYRRTTRTLSSVVHHCYFSNRWKPLEERLDASTDAERQYLWGARPDHRDELILRDRDTNSSGTLDERLYVAMDYFSPTAVFDTSGVVQERYGFSGFGIRRIMAPDFSDRAVSNFAVEFAFHGQFLDNETGWYDYGYRYYSPEIGRWLSRDPIEEAGGENLYTFAYNNPRGLIDDFGLAPRIIERVYWESTCTVTIPCVCADDTSIECGRSTATETETNQTGAAESRSDAVRAAIDSAQNGSCSQTTDCPCGPTCVPKNPSGGSQSLLGLECDTFKKSQLL